MVLGIRQLAYPHTPREVEACLDAAENGAVVVQRDGEPMLVIMPIGDYERLSALADSTEAYDFDSQAGGAQADSRNTR